MPRPLLNSCARLAALLLIALCGGAAARAQSTPLCPRVEVSCPAVPGGGDATEWVFSVKLDPPANPARLAYEWVVSAGTVMSGLGTPSISLNPAGVENLGATATVDVRGLPEGCPASASCTVMGRIVCIRPLDEYGNLDFEDEMARLDNLAVELQNDPAAGGHLICYGGKVGRAGEALARCERAKEYLNSRRGIEASRIVTVDGGYRENLSVALWVVPSGAAPPPPSPTVDPSEVTIIKGKRARKK